MMDDDLTLGQWPPRILIAIHGSHSQQEQMQAQRETWLKDLRGADYKFFLGSPEVSNSDIQTDVVCGDFLDGPLWQRPGYRSWVGNRKTEALCRYALENDYDFVFKCDDDTYVRTEMLFASGFQEHDYSGFAEKHYTCELGWYRWTQGGAGYWLSRRAMEIVAQNGLHVIPAEDFSVGNILAANGIHPHHDDRYKPSLTSDEHEPPGSLSRYITLHKADPAAMRLLHKPR